MSEIRGGGRSSEGELFIQAKANEYRVALEAVYKFRFFFAALVFTIYSFAMQFSVVTNFLLVDVLQIISWLFFMIVGFFAIKDCGGFSKEFTEESMAGLTRNQRAIMWALFGVALFLQLIVRACKLFI